MAVTIIGWGAPARAEDWVRILTNQAGNVYYVDLDSIETEAGLRNFWSLVETRSPLTYQDDIVYNSASFYVTVNCQQRLYNIRLIRLMDASSTVLQEYTLNDPAFYQTAPGSAEEASMRFVCSQ